MLRSGFKGMSGGGILSLWQREAGLRETSACEQRDSLKLAAAPQVSPGRNSQNIVGKLFCQIFFCFCLWKKKNKKLPNVFLRVKFDKSCREFVLQNRRSQSVCISLVKFCFTHA